MKHQGYNSSISSTGNSTAQKFKYNGKELDQSFNLNTYDLGARQMDPALGRFMTIDPLADIVNYQSPYVMADNNPILYVDVFGLQSQSNWKRFWKNLFGRKNRYGGTRTNILNRGTKKSNSRSTRASRKAARDRKKASRKSSSSNSGQDPNNGRTKMNPMDFNMAGINLFETDLGIEGIALNDFQSPIDIPKKPEDDDIDIPWFEDDIYGLIKIDKTINIRFTSSPNSGGLTTSLDLRRNGPMLGNILKTLASDPKLNFYIQISNTDAYGAPTNMEFYEKQISNLIEYLKSQGIRNSQIKRTKDETRHRYFIK